MLPGGKSTKSLIRLVVLLTFGATRIFGNFPWDSAKETRREICKTEECKKLGAVFNKNLNKNVQPCDDFHEFACGNWEKHHPMPSNVMKWNVDGFLSMKALDQLKDVLEAKESPRTREFRWAKWIYVKCRDMPLLEQGDAEFVRSRMYSIYTPIFLNEEQEKSRRKPWWMVAYHYLKQTSESGLFYITVTTNPEKDNEIVMGLRNPISAYGTILVYDDWSPDEMRIYAGFLVKLAKLVAPPKVKVSDSALMNSVLDVITFRTELEELIKDYDEAGDIYFSTNVKELQDAFDAKREGQTNWLQLLRPLHHELWGLQITEKQMIKIKAGEYFLKLAELLSSTPEKIIANHLHLYFVERHLELDRDLQSMLMKAIPGDTGEIRHRYESWQLCIMHHPMKPTLGKMYDQVYLSPDTRAAVANIGERLRNLMKLQACESTWNSDRCARMLTKIDNIRLQIGYPDFYDDPAVEPRWKEFVIDPSEANSYFIRTLNILDISTAALQSPLYTPRVPYTVELGTTGSLIGHEFYHTFDDHSNQYDENANLSRWWTDDMRVGYKKQRQCFIDQYDKYTIKELDGAHAQGNLTYNEDMPDTMGLKLSYLTFKKQLAKEKGVCSVLPQFEKYTCEQMFFISFANTLCGLVPRKTLLTDFEDEDHSIPRLRVNGAVSNLKEFSSAFKCSDQSPLNPETRCDLWRDHNNPDAASRKCCPAVSD